MIRTGTTVLANGHRWTGRRLDPDHAVGSTGQCASSCRFPGENNAGGGGNAADHEGDFAMAARWSI